MLSIYLRMRKTKSGFILFVFFFSTLLLQFCKKEDKGTFRRYIHKFLFVEFNSLSDPYYNFYNANDTLNVVLKDTNDFIIVAEDTAVQISYANSNGNLYATSPLPPLTVEQDSLIILTVNNFDALHPAGSDVSDCFLISSVYAPANLWLPLDQFRQIVKNNYLHDFKLHLIKHPNTNALKLKLHFYNKDYSDGIMLQSPTIVFKP